MRGFVGAVCAIGVGAVIGASTALLIDPAGNGWWILGALLGGGLAYVIYDFKTTWAAIRATFVETGEFVGYVSEGAVSMLFSLSFWKTLVVSTLATLVIVPQLAAVFFFGLKGLAAAGNLSDLGYLVINHPSDFVRVVLYFSGFVGVLLTIMSDQDSGNLAEARSIAYKVIMNGNPIAIFIYWPIVLTYRFLKACITVIRLVHNDDRMLCFVYGGMGAAAGYFIGRMQLGLSTQMTHVIGPIAGAVIMIGLAVLGRKMLQRSSNAAHVGAN